MLAASPAGSAAARGGNWESSQKQSSQKSPEVESNFATTVSRFATTPQPAGKFATGDLGDLDSADAVPFQGINRDEWRIIYRLLPPKKDGSVTLSFYYRRRTSYVNKDGKRVVPYLPGGKITKNGTERELRAHKKRHRADR